MKYKWYYKIPLFGLLGILALIGLGYVVMYLWNQLIPVLFHGPVITFWQAAGLFILAKILLHGFNHRTHHWNSGRYHNWRARMEEKMASMTPEEKDKFKEEWARHCRPGYWRQMHSRFQESPGKEV
jgi:hypothetical protein